ncbi:hypothetical protein BRARA_E00822 [Brassica rapa]|uniref:Uncharacterized protein n=1 Tax=Brassica campestris TaxID=3711 RepID=A0A397Z8B2_BRACM|nr:hypothetical protein BRARA_E00822 [Brassica rapa]
MLYTKARKEEADCRGEDEIIITLRTKFFKGGVMISLVIWLSRTKLRSQIKFEAFMQVTRVFCDGNESICIENFIKQQNFLIFSLLF